MEKRCQLRVITHPTLQRVRDLDPIEPGSASSQSCVTGLPRECI